MITDLCRLVAVAARLVAKEVRQAQTADRKAAHANE